MSSISKKQHLSRPAAPTQPPTVSTGRLSPTQTQSVSPTVSTGRLSLTQTQSASPTQHPTVSTGRLSPTQAQSSSGTLSPPPHPPMRASSRHRYPNRTRHASSSSADDMIDSSSAENGSGRLPTIRDTEQRPRRKGVRGACKAVKTTRIVRTSNQRIKVIFHPKYDEPVDLKISSMLSHDLGAIIRSNCPMNHGYWEDVPEDQKKDLADQISVNFDIDLDMVGLRGYIDLVMARRFRDFKHELHKHFQLFSSPEEALANPPLEIIERDAVHEWEYLCEHFQSQDFLRASNANKANRSKKKMEHRAGSLSFSHLVMQCAEEGSQFAEIDAFEKAYAGKNKQWTNETAKAKHDEMVAKKNEYLELAKEYPEGTSPDEMSIADQDAGHNIVIDVLGKKPGRQKRRLGFGLARGSSSSLASSTRLQQLEDQLVAERTAREATQNYLQKIVQQISSVVPGFVPPPADFLVTPETQHVDDEDRDHSSLG